MTAAELIAELQRYPSDLQVVTTPDNQYDEDGEITNYTDTRVKRLEGCQNHKGLLYIYYAEELLEPEDIKKGDDTSGT
jgi:hypothetical protein